MHGEWVGMQQNTPLLAKRIIKTSFSNFLKIDKTFGIKLINHLIKASYFLHYQ